MLGPAKWIHALSNLGPGVVAYEPTSYCRAQQLFIIWSIRVSGEHLEHGLHRSLMAQTVKNLPAVQETWVQLLGQEDPLEKEMPIHSSILTWRIPWTEDPGGLQSMRSQRVGHN